LAWLSAQNLETRDLEHLAHLEQNSARERRGDVEVLSSSSSKEV